MVAHRKQILRKKMEKEIPFFVVAIALIDIVVSLVMMFMIGIGLMAMSSATLNTTAIFFLTLLILLVVATLVCVYGLLTKKAWGIPARITLAAVLTAVSLYKLFISKSTMNVLFFYDLFVLLYLSFLKMRRKDRY